MSPLILAAVIPLSDGLEGADALKRAFNAAKGKVRVVMLVSPT